MKFFNSFLEKYPAVGEVVSSVSEKIKSGSIAFYGRAKDFATRSYVFLKRHFTRNELLAGLGVFFVLAVGTVVAPSSSVGLIMRLGSALFQTAGLLGIYKLGKIAYERIQAYRAAQARPQLQRQTEQPKPAIKNPESENKLKQEQDKLLQAEAEKVNAAAAEQNNKEALGTESLQSPSTEGTLSPLPSDLPKPDVTLDKNQNNEQLGQAVSEVPSSSASEPKLPLASNLPKPADVRKEQPKPKARGRGGKKKAVQFEDNGAIQTPAPMVPTLVVQQPEVVETRVDPLTQSTFEHSAEVSPVLPSQEPAGLEQQVSTLLSSTEQLASTEALSANGADSTVESSATLLTQSLEQSQFPVTPIEEAPLSPPVERSLVEAAPRVEEAQTKTVENGHTEKHANGADGYVNGNGRASSPKQDKQDNGHTKPENGEQTKANETPKAPVIFSLRTQPGEKKVGLGSAASVEPKPNSRSTSSKTQTSSRYSTSHSRYSPDREEHQQNGSSQRSKRRGRYGY